VEGKHLNAGLRGGLFEVKHYARMGDAVWLFGWMVLRQTTEQGGQGLVLDGRPITYQEICRDTGFPLRTLQRWMAGLKAGGYIEIEYPRSGMRRIPLGMRVRILKAKKFSAGQFLLRFGEAPERAATGIDAPPVGAGVAAKSGGGNTRKNLEKPPGKESPGWLLRAREYAFETWAERVQQKPTWSEKDYTLLAKLLKRSPELTLSEFERRWRNYLDSTDPFLQSQGYSLAYFCTHFDAFLWGSLEGTAGERERRREARAGRNPCKLERARAP